MGHLHKTFSPSTYPCKLCAISYGRLGMKTEWKKYLDTTGHEPRFYHSDQFYQKYGFLIPSLPSVYLRRGREWKVILNQDDFATLHSLDQLKEKLERELKAVEWMDYPL